MILKLVSADFPADKLSKNEHIMHDDLNYKLNINYKKSKYKQTFHLLIKKNH